MSSRPPLFATTVLGSPCFWGAPYQDHTPAQLAALADLGYRGVFANIAWSRPWMDVVTLEELVLAPSFPWLCDPEAQRAPRLAEMRRRVDAIVAAGLRPYFILGSPRALRLDRVPEEQRAWVQREMQGSSRSRISGDDQVACIQSPAVRQLAEELLRALLQAFPETAGVLIYTQDELAEVCDEQDDCPRCHGVPLEQRLPGYLAHLRDVLDPQVEVWWEPWEFTAAQTYAMVERLPQGVDLAVHSCIYEVYFVNQPDLWFRHLARLAERRGVRMMVNLFLSGTGEDLGPLAAYPCPRLVVQQLAAIAAYPAVRGFKEYYGTTVEHLNVNDWALRAWLAAPQSDWDALASELAARYAPLPSDPLVEAWELAAMSLEVFPWDLSWRLRQYNSYRYDQHAADQPYWAIAFVQTLPTPWTTPSWESSRRGFYVTSGFETPRLLDETEQRLGRSADYAAQALALLEQALTAAAELEAARRRELDQQLTSLRIWRHLVLSRQMHLQASELARRVRAGEREPVAELQAVLAAGQANARALLELAESTPWQAFNLRGLRATLAEMPVERQALAHDPLGWCAQRLK